MLLGFWAFSLNFLSRTSFHSIREESVFICNGCMVLQYHEIHGFLNIYLLNFSCGFLRCPVFAFINSATVNICFFVYLSIYLYKIHFQMQNCFLYGTHVLKFIVHSRLKVWDSLESYQQRVRLSPPPTHPLQFKILPNFSQLIKKKSNELEHLKVFCVCVCLNMCV